jgi:transcriptional regulator with PAS, ATPase and Fis domain
MREIFDLVAHVSDLAVNVLIVGESGTGKEMIARAIHQQSTRVEKSFIPLNCAAIPETLLESELFGHVRGAFTDARKDRRGLFQAANGGVLFLDEISEMPLSLQAKLLRVIEDKEVRPLGADYAEKVDTRLVSACNRDPERLVQEGHFRQDLYYRLNVIRIDLPPLRERAEDIPILVDHFIQKFASQTQRPLDGIEPEALDALLNYRWPGNVRELEHTIERAVHLGKEIRIGLQDFPPSLAARSDNVVPLAEAAGKSYTLKDLEKEYIRRVMERVHGNKTEAAKTLGVDRTTLYRKLEEYKVKG